ncbi:MULTISPECIES: DNA-binding protein [Halorussus]|uniref:DNA-binding protein n=1 Tax=Halorussus TaxID=1070314 RepID=UPI0020A00EFA|nr:DNA-binding protein [Halorussus vallis]USZ75003.1 DNA-binding protein [Halorussus vallis]
MTTTNTIGKERWVDGQERDWADAERFPDVEETPELEATVELEIQAKVDLNHPEGVGRGLALEAEERLLAREWELERTRRRMDRDQDSDREARTRAEVEKGSVERRTEFEKRAASVDPWQHPDQDDPREMLSQEELAAVNQQTVRIAEKLPRWSRAAISRRLAERVVDGASVLSAVVGVHEELQTEPGYVIPIAKVGEVNRREVSIHGTVEVLWQATHPKIAQVGLIEDETGRIRFTVWHKSRAPIVREGEQVEFRSVAKNWYEGRCSVALTGWSTVNFPERGR